MKSHLYAACKYWAPVIAWMSLIFVFSTDLFSSSNTSSLLSPLLSSLFPSLSSDQLEAIHNAIRKVGHWSEYFILAVLLGRALRAQFPGQASRGRFAAGVAVAVVYAASDEWHQSFVPSRAASIVDVMIDSFGAICGALAFNAANGSKPTGISASRDEESVELPKKT